MRLHYGEPQVAVGVIFVVLTALIALVFLAVARSAGQDVPYERVQRIGYWLRPRWLAALVVVGFVLLPVTVFYLPYASGSGTGRTVVKVTSGQFFWSLAPDRVRAGTPVRFDVSSLDVNHGFGLYDPHGHLVGSVQAMPGYHNKLDMTFDLPGHYRVRCLEFCGFRHAVMQADFVVLPARARGG